MKKIILGASLIFIGTSAFAQGLDSIIVEKYYISNAADAVGTYSLTPGSVTYRVYADLAAGYQFQATYGEAPHNLLVTTSTAFFNNSNRGKKSGDLISSGYLTDNTVALDSWFSVGGSADDQVGVLKSEDDGTANMLFPHNPVGLLSNSTSAMGIALTAQDGNIAGTPEPANFVGFVNELNVFTTTNLLGDSLMVNNAAISSLNGSVGPTAFNRVLIGQFTTDGIFHFELNIQVRNGGPGGAVEKWVASNPGSGELTMASLTYTSATPNVMPQISITTPTPAATFTVGATVAIAATASDTDGTIDSVSFFIDGVRIGKDASSPYTKNYIATVGTHTLTAVATDNNGGQTISTPQTIIVNPGTGLLPTVSITSPISGTTYTVGATMVAIAATAADADGTVDSVSFFVDGLKVGSDISSPYTFTTNVSAVGSHTLTAVATDNDGGQKTSAAKIIIVTPVTGIEELSSLSTLSIYPNPTNSIVTIEINATKPGVGTYAIYDITGNILISNKLGVISGNFKEQVNVSSLAAGLYMLEISIDGATSTKKLIVN